MKKFFKIIITIVLFLFSINYTNKCIKLLQQKDPLMKKIQEVEKEYYVSPIEPTVTKNIIIPGINGKKVNIKKSYQKMKKLGSFNESLLVYETIKPNNSYLDIYDKVIIPRKSNNLSLIFDINNNINLFNKINKILENNNVVGNLLNNNFPIENTFFINNLATTYQENIDYCLTNSLNINNECIKNKKYTVLSPSSIINNYHLSNTKNIIKENNIIIYSFNDNNINDLDIIIKYLKNNFYNIVSINELVNLFYIF